MEMQAKAELVEVIRERYLCSIKKQRARGHSTLRPALWAALLAALWAIHLIASAVDHEIQVLRMLLSVLTKPAY